MEDLKKVNVKKTGRRRLRIEEFGETWLRRRKPTEVCCANDDGDDDDDDDDDESHLD